MKNKIIVLTNYRGYNQVRNFLYRETNIYKTSRTRDLSAIIHAFFHKYFGKSYKILLQSYFGSGIRKHDLIHLWNGIYFWSKPWVTTLEMPDYMGYRKDSLLIKIKRYYWKSKYCKKIIFTSKWAKQNTLSKWSKYYNRQIYNQIVEKSTILHPPQKRPILNLVEKKINDKIKLLFVGADFYRKGGLELLIAVDKLIKENNLNLELTIVSALNLSDYPVDANSRTHQKALEIIDKNESISHITSLPNKEVLALMQDSHIFCFPTYLDTYGYVVLEAMANGTPVISTNQRALSEINNDTIGWLLKMPLDAMDTIDRKTDETKESNHLLLCSLIEKTLIEISNDKNIIYEKSKACYEYIKMNHDYDRHANTLGLIYQEAMSK